MADKRKYNRKTAAELRTMVAERDDIIEKMDAELKKLRKEVKQTQPHADAYTVMQWDCPTCVNVNTEVDSIEDGEVYICGECGDSVILNVV